MIKAALMMLVVAWATHSTAEPQGVYRGAIAIPNGTLTLLLNFDGSGDDLNARISVIEQDVRDFPVTSVSCDDGTVRVELAPFKIVIMGRLSEDGTSMRGSYRQNGSIIPLRMQRQATS